jgi:hypothetical protein
VCGLPTTMTTRKSDTAGEGGADHQAGGEAYTKPATCIVSNDGESCRTHRLAIADDTTELPIWQCVWSLVGTHISETAIASVFFARQSPPREELFRCKRRSPAGLRYGVEDSVRPAANGRSVISSAAQGCWGIEGRNKDLAAGTLSLYHVCSAHGW